MAQQLKKSLVFIAMAMLVMAFSVSAARILDEQLTVPPVTVDQDTDVVRAHGTTKAPMNGCLNVKAVGAKLCGNLTTPAVGDSPAPAAPLTPPPPPPGAPAQTGN